MVGVLLYTTSPVLATGFLDVLAPVDDIDARAVGGPLSEFFSAMESLRPPVVLIDLTPDLGWDFLSELRTRHFVSRVVLWMQNITVEMAHNAKEIGVRGIIRKDSPVELLIRCLRKVAEGEFWFERTLLNELLTVREVRLSPRERQLLQLVSQGLSNKQVAAALSIAEGTVKVYFSKLFRKLNVNDRFELALYGLRHLGGGMVPLSESGRAETSFPSSLVVRTSAPR